MTLNTKEMENETRSRRSSHYSHSDHQGLAKNCSINSKNQAEIEKKEDLKGKSTDSSQSNNKSFITSKDIVLMFLIGTLAAGNGYIIESVQSFEPVLQARYEYTAFTVSILNSIVAFPKVFTSFLEGYLLTKFGFIMAVIITSIGLLGQTFYAIGIIIDQYWLSVMGRFIIGAEFNMMFTTQYLIT